MIENCTYDSIKNALKNHFQKANNQFTDPRLYKAIDKKESEEDFKDRMGYPKIKPAKVLKECGLG